MNALTSVIPPSQDYSRDSSCARAEVRFSRRSLRDPYALRFPIRYRLLETTFPRSICWGVPKGILFSQLKGIPPSTHRMNRDPTLCFIWNGVYSAAICRWQAPSDPHASPIEQPLCTPIPRDAPSHVFDTNPHFPLASLDHPCPRETASVRSRPQLPEGTPRVGLSFTAPAGSFA